MPNPVKPKVLFVTPVFPNNTEYGLAMRAGALLEALASHSSVYLIIIPVYDPDRTILHESMHSFCTQYHIVTISKYDRVMARLKSVVQGLRRQTSLPLISLLTSDRLSKAIEQVFNQVNFDFLYIFRIYLTPLMLSGLSKTSFKGRYLDLDDIESQTRTRLAALYRTNGLYAKARLEEQTAQLYKAFEQKFLPEFDKISVCSQKDKTAINQLFPDQNIHILPNVVSPLIEPPPARHTETFNLLFVGNLNYYPNQDAVAFFIGEVMPVLRSIAKQPVCFTIIGSGKWKELHQYQNIADCRYIGFVEDVNPYYEQADTVVVPLRAGGGTRIKVLEAFSFKRPVVTTTIGVEGIDVEHEKHVLIADKPEHFARMCCKIMKNHQLSAKLTTKSFECLKDNYTHDVLRQRMSRMIE